MIIEKDQNGKENNKQLLDRKIYIFEMRKTFSNKNSILENGNINHNYFQTKVGLYWGIEENNQLMKGIEEYGVGVFDKIKHKYLRKWSETEIKLRTCILLKCFNIEEYYKKKLNVHEIKKESDNNQREGIEKRKFHNEIYYNK